ncbi:hypothetical protein MMB17_18105 [Methylobacterium organophilum]|uniref:GCG_CRPN prefix-to-repeats domain-containing protein n=1 Tax=Methylobacterium organophilum TaxID=410 RepID=UPI001F141CA0|nr:hypothetical protein [Methylobacterium organophilum]UMY16583.1 hypothetical protein MMB17_18105 [Methylobacterium organophilum]
MRHAKVLAMAAAIAGGLGLATAAQAAPFSPAPLGASAPIEKVDWACGPGFHLNPWGHCRPNWGYGPRPYWRRSWYGPGPGFYRPPPPRYYGYYGPRPFY